MHTHSFTHNLVKRIYTHSSNSVHRVEQLAEKKEMQNMMEKKETQNDAPTAVASFVNVPGQLSPVSAGPYSTVQACAQDLLLGAAIVQSCVF